MIDADEEEVSWPSASAMWRQRMAEALRHMREVFVPLHNRTYELLEKINMALWVIVILLGIILYKLW